MSLGKEGPEMGQGSPEVEGKVAGGGKAKDKKSSDLAIQRRPKRGSNGGRSKPSALGMVKSHGRQHGLSMEGVNSGAERTESEGIGSGEKVASSSSTSAATVPVAANLYNANNLPKEALQKVEQFESELKKNPQNVPALLGWGRLLVSIARNVIATHTSPESVKNDVRLIKDSLFVACTKFQDAQEIEPDNPFTLVEWADTLILIASNFDLPLFDMAMEKYQAANMMHPRSHKILQRYGLALAKQATFVHAHGSGGSENMTYSELDAMSERLITEAMNSKSNSFSTLLSWTEAIAERLRRTLNNEIVLSLLRELGDTFIKALHLKPLRCSILQNWAYVLDQTLEGLVQYGLLPEDSFLPLFMDFCHAYEFLSALDRVSMTSRGGNKPQGGKRESKKGNGSLASSSGSGTGSSVSSSSSSKVNVLSTPVKESKIPKNHLSPISTNSDLRSSRSSPSLIDEAIVNDKEVEQVSSSEIQGVSGGRKAKGEEKYADPFDGDEWEPKVAISVPLKPLMAFSLMEYSEKVRRKAYETLEFLAEKAKSQDTREEALRHVECLKILFSNRKEIWASNVKRAEETIGMLPVKALREWERSGLEIEQVAQKFDIFMNCLYFVVDKDTAKDAIFHQQKKKRTLQLPASIPSSSWVGSSSSSSVSSLSGKGVVKGGGTKENQKFSSSSSSTTSLGEISSGEDVSSSSTTSSSEDEGEEKKGVVKKERKSGKVVLPYSGSPVLAVHIQAPSLANAGYQGPAQLKRTLSPEEFERIVRRENPKSHYSHLVSIGSGGFGEVFTGESVHTGNKVALKVMPGALSTDFVSKHTNEIEAMRRLSHPNIVQFEDVFYYDNQIWLVMEYCDGGTLENLYQEVFLSEVEIAYFIRQICIGLHYLHMQQLAHLDIKAENILLNLNGGIKIADFGLVREVSSDRDTLTSMVGTSYWLAPEVIQRKPYGQKVDIWALGCVCLELADGKPPRHELGSLRAMFLTATQGPPPFNSHPDSSHPPWSDKMLDFLKQTLHMDPKRRPTAAQLLEHPFLQSRALSVKELRRKLELVFIGASLRANGLL
jgi:p21-activated kinase 1